MCFSVTEIKREMCRCPFFYVLFLRGIFNWNVLGYFFIHWADWYAYSFYRRFLPLFCHYRYIISPPKSSLISFVLVKFDFTLIVRLWQRKMPKSVLHFQRYCFASNICCYFIFSLSSNSSLSCLLQLACSVTTEFFICDQFVEKLTIRYTLGARGFSCAVSGYGYVFRRRSSSSHARKN